jgi:hypothetical protein
MLLHGRVDSRKVSGAVLQVVLVFCFVVDDEPKLLQLCIGSDAHACLEQVTVVLVEKGCRLHTAANQVTVSKGALPDQPARG